LVIVGTGGTISSRQAANGGLAATDSAAHLAESVPAPPGKRLEADDFMRKNSFELTLGDMGRLARRVAMHAARPEVAGVVVTHGTDTIEETACLLEWTRSAPKPIVLTGAQRDADSPDSDGQANLRDALALAASPLAQGLGVLVQFGGSVYSGIGLRKARTIALSPFDQPNGGAIGAVVNGQALIWQRPPRRPAALPLPTEAFGQVRVDIVATYPSADQTLAVAAQAAGAKGIVIEGTGCGNANSQLNSWIAQASAAGVVVVLGTRVAGGPMIAQYSAGGGFDAVRQGALPSGLLTVPQARILLALLLDREPPAQAAATFARYSTSVPARAGAPNRKE
jgi:L-asparaginase